MSFWTESWNGMPKWAWASIAGVGGGVVIYFIRQRKLAAAAAAGGSSGTASVAGYGPSSEYGSLFPGAGLLQPIIVGQGGSSTGTTTDPTTVTPVTPAGAFQAGTGSANEQTWLQKLATAGDIPNRTIPLYGTAASGTKNPIVGAIPYGTPVNPTGPEVSAMWPGGQIVHLFPVAGGFVGASDVAA